MYALSSFSGSVVNLSVEIHAETESRTTLFFLSHRNDSNLFLKKKGNCLLIKRHSRSVTEIPSYYEEHNDHQYMLKARAI